MRYYELIDNFHIAHKKCIDAGVFIFPECIVNDTRWRIVVEFKDNQERLKERKVSDDPKLSNPKYYYSKAELDIKLMEMYFFYADRI